MIGRGLLLLVALAGLLGPACERFTGEKEEAPAIKREAADRVVDRVCARLTEIYAKEGPLTFNRLPEVKDAAAKAEDLEGGWAEFQSRVQSTDPSLEVEYSRRITEHMRKLGEKPDEPD